MLEGVPPKFAQDVQAVNAAFQRVADTAGEPIAVMFGVWRLAPGKSEPNQEEPAFVSVQQVFVPVSMRN